MHKLSPTDALFPRIRLQVIGRLFANPERWTYQSELAQDLGVSQSSLQLELKRLASSGILNSELRGNRVYFKPNKNCVIFDELSGIALKTAGLADLVRDTLRQFKRKIALAFIFGSIARGQEHAESDVDLMIIGDLTLTELSPAIRPLEKQLARDVNPHLLTVTEAKEMLRSPNHFFSTVLGSPKLYLVRSDHELARLFEQRSAEKAHDIQAGDQRS